MMAAQKPPFDQNLVETAKAARIITEMLGIPVESKKIGWTLKKAGCFRVDLYIEATLEKSGRMASVWVIRNWKTYANPDGKLNLDAIRFEMEKQT